MHGLSAAEPLGAVSSGSVLCQRVQQADGKEVCMNRKKPFEHRKWLEGLLHAIPILKQVLRCCLGRKRNDFCRGNINKSSHSFNNSSNGERMVIRITTLSTIKSPSTFHYFATISYILLHFRYMLCGLHIVVTL